MKELLLGFLGKTLNMPDESVAEKLFKKSDDGKILDELDENALQTLLDLDANRVKTLRESINTKEFFDNGYGKGKKEALELLEKQIREQFKVDSTRQGLDLINDVIAKTGKAQIEDDKVKLHPLYLGLEERLKSEVEKLRSEYEGQIGQIKTDYANREMRVETSQVVNRLLDDLKIVIPDGKAVLKEDFVNLLLGANQFEKADGKFIAVRDGKRLEDSHGNAITLDQLVRTEAAKRFEFRKQDDKGNAGNKNGDGGSGSGVVLPKNQDEYLERYFAANTPEERAQLKVAWDAANK